MDKAKVTIGSAVGASAEGAGVVSKRLVTTWTDEGVVKAFVRDARPIADRIVEAYRKLWQDQRGEAPRYYDMLTHVFPRDEYPDAWRYSANGGPPGCAMSFGRALRQMGGSTSGRGSGRAVFIPSRALRREGPAS